MVTLFNQETQLVPDGGEDTTGQQQPGGGGFTPTPTPTPSPTPSPDDDPDDGGTIPKQPPVLKSLYQKSRHPNNLSFPPASGGEPLQPASETVRGMRILFSVTDTDAFYRWTGLFDFDNTEVDFGITATNQFRVKLDSQTIIDDFRIGPTRTRIERVTVPAGVHQITVEWGVPNGAGTIRFTTNVVAQQSWVSCEDGVARDGLPPDGWIRTADGCFKPPLGGDPSDTDLIQVVDITPDSDLSVERAYVLDSGTALSPHRIKFFNRAENMTVLVQLSGPTPVKFVTAFQVAGDVGVGGLPASSFELGIREEKEIDMVFLADEMNKLPEGLLRSNILVSLAAGTVTLAKDSDDDISVGTPSPEGEPILLPLDPVDLPPLPPPPTPTWSDCSSGTAVVRDGFPPSDFILRDDGCYIPAPTPELVVTMLIRPKELEPTFDGTRSTARAQLLVSLAGDDPTTYSYRWNFDVNKQGAGTGDTTAQSTTVGWLLTNADLIRLEDPNDGQTTRTVEVIATKGVKVIRSRVQVVLDNPSLAFIAPPEKTFQPIEPTLVRPVLKIADDGKKFLL